MIIMAFPNDYDVRFGASSPTTSYYSKWISTKINQKMGYPSTFLIEMDAVALSGLPVSAGNYFGLYYNNSVTPSFCGRVTSVSYASPKMLTVEGMDMYYNLLRHPPYQIKDETKCLMKDLSLSGLLEKLLEDDAGSPLIPIGVIEDMDLPWKQNGIELPLTNRLNQVLVVQQALKDRYFYVSEVDGKFYAKTTKGDSTSVLDYYLTGVAPTITGKERKAWLGQRDFNGARIMNDVILISTERTIRTRFSDFTPTECTLIGGDNFLDAPYNTEVGFETMYLKGTAGMPSTGSVILREGTVSWRSVLKALALVSYTGISGNTLTGCTVTLESPLLPKNFMAGGMVLNASKIVVDTTSGFPASGSIQIGEEIIPYDSLTTETVDGVSRGIFVLTQASTTKPMHRAVTSSTDSGAVSQLAEAITINCTSTSTFASSGYLSIGMGLVGAFAYKPEIVKYTGTTATSFTGCSRGVGQDGVVNGIPAHTSITNVFITVPHPANILVKKFIDYPSTPAEVGSSVYSNGIKSICLLGNGIDRASIETFGSTLLRNQRYGDQFHSLVPIRMGDWDDLTTGDKITITDSNIGLSALDARVTELILSLNRAGVYSMTIKTMPYNRAFTAVPDLWTKYCPPR